MFDPSVIIGGLGSIAKLFIPHIEDHVQQKYENEFKDSLSDYQNIISLPDDNDKRSKLAGYVGQLCIRAGTPTGALSGQSIEIPLESFNSLITIANGKIRDDELLARLNFKSI